MLLFVSGTVVFAQDKANTGFSVGARLIGVIPFYEPGSGLKEMTEGVSLDMEGDFGIGFAVQGVYKFTPLLGVQVEGIYNADKAKIKAMGIELGTLEAKGLLVPILLRVETVLNAGVLVGGVGGIYFTIPLGDGETSGLMGSAKGEWTGSMGFMIGGIAGYPIGPGVLFADIRYAGDVNDIAVEVESGRTKLTFLKRSGVHLGIGYSYTF
jgi:hypothetical protein